MARDYKTTIVQASRELSGKERVQMKDLGLAIGIDSTVTAEEPLQLKVVDWAIIHIDNPRAKDGNSTEYDTLVIVAEDGRKYYSGSPSLSESFLDIWEEMQGCDEEYEILVYRRPSRNRQDKYFLTCSIM